ncbi:hypothetical protein [Fusobacterium nucleatum]|uniref:hypothetical protein n=1 Tax=Fusobacterium nucleatum TaxID=851 RepID=UPI0004229D1E|nr:hypothetical protein [Fusobacterium nucleatum]ALF23641.1 hypothetical protein RO05_04375 [Fusobacterium nucleatum subsp. nucleatum ChDC F316]ASG26997.1 hypothetical protein RN84_09510 [Fusobacterium nucleatum subsp. nucleatum]
MAIKINLEKNGYKKKAFLGFSYTTFFLNFLVPLFRGDAKRFIKFFFIWSVTMLPATLIDNFPHQINNWNNPIIKNFIISLFDIKYKYIFLIQSLIVWTFFIIHIIIWFFIAKNYNKNYTRQLLNNGYIPVENDNYTLTLLEEYLEYSKKEKYRKEIELYNNIIETVNKEEKKKSYIFVIVIFIFNFCNIHKIYETYNKLGDITHFEYTQKYI